MEEQGEKGYVVKGDVEEVEEGMLRRNEGECKDLLLWQKSS